MRPEWRDSDRGGHAGCGSGYCCGTAPGHDSGHGFLPAPCLSKGAKSFSGNLASRIIPVTADAKRLPLPDNRVDSVAMALWHTQYQPKSGSFCGDAARSRAGRTGLYSGIRFRAGKIMGGLYNFYLNNILPVVGALCQGQDSIRLSCANNRQFSPAGTLPLK